MTDITPSLNALLRQHGSTPVSRHRYSVDQLDEFLKEAYNINARISDLTAYLRANRGAYLSTSTDASRPGRHDLARAHIKSSASSPRPLTDTERAEIDAHSKTLIRQLNGAISNLADAERVRVETTALVAARKRTRNGLGALGTWAAGGVARDQTPAELASEAKEKAFAAHREGVLWYLQKRLGEAGQIQAYMIETRLQREEEKAKSVLYKSRGAESRSEHLDPSLLPQQSRSGLISSEPGHLTDDIDNQLTEEQVQLFAEENQGMLKHLGQQLDQVRAVSKSLEEISQLQTSLMANLDSQNANIDQLVQDSFFTEDNVGRGNQQLKKASEKTSTARLLFHSTCAFCTFLVVWDLIF